MVIRASPHLSFALYINIIYFVKYGYAIYHTYFIFHFDGTRQGDPISRLLESIKSGDGNSNEPTRDGAAHTKAAISNRVEARQSSQHKTGRSGASLYGLKRLK